MRPAFWPFAFALFACSHPAPTVGATSNDGGLQAEAGVPAAAPPGVGPRVGWGPCPEHEWVVRPTDVLVDGIQTYPPRDQDDDMATVLADGRVLLGAAEAIYDPVRDAYELLPTHDPYTVAGTATLLADKRSVLISGGAPAAGGASDRAFLFDVEAHAWREIAHMQAARGGHHAALLPDGRVFVVGGGYTGELPMPVSEIFDPATETWTALDSPPNLLGALDPMWAYGYMHMTSLPSGDVFVAGNDEDCAVYVFRWKTSRWEEHGPVPRYTPMSAIALPDGRVWMHGVGSCHGPGGPTPPSADLYDPATRVWTRVSAPQIATGGFKSAYLGCGGIVIFGGTTWNVGDNSPQPQLYDLARDEWYVTTGEAPKWFRKSGFPVTLPDGSVFFAYASTVSWVNSGPDYPAVLRTTWR